MKLTNSVVAFALILLSIPVLAGNTPPPDWVTQRPNLPDTYWGIGQVACTGSLPNSEEKQEAYQYAAAELSAMIGQRIVTSFSNTKLDLYSAHRMTNDCHDRIYEDGRTEALPSLDCIRICSEDPEEDARLEKEQHEEDLRVLAILEAKGFGIEGDEPGGVQIRRYQQLLGPEG